MKLNGIFGTGSGKVGASVWAVSSGVQIVRPYQPNVSNPNTDAQVAQRAKLKLMSQLAAALASIIAFKKEGLVSARNRFVSANIGLVTFENGQAAVNIQNIDLTGSKSSLPDVNTYPVEQGSMNVDLAGSAAADVDAVLYASVRQTAEQKLEVVDVKISTTPGNNRIFATQLRATSDETCVYAYGIKYTNDAARQRFADYVANIAADSATLDVVSRELLAGASFTRTTYGQV